MLSGRANGHLSDEQLAAFSDGDLAATDAAHLESCPDCAARLRELERAMAAYVEYRDSARGAGLPPPPRAWASMDALIARGAAAGRFPAMRWGLSAAAAAAVCAAIIVLVLNKGSARNSMRASELLTRSEATSVAAGRMISMRLGGEAFVRPAVLTTDATYGNDRGARHLRSLFVAAHYDWSDPLSARSFQQWRSGLTRKQDSVSVIQRRGEQSYRVRTETPTGALRSASITLRALDLYPTDETFAFVGEGPLELTDAPAAAPQPAEAEAPHEIQASPADVLHVLAALDVIGADVDNPIELSLDSERNRVVVQAGELSEDRVKQIADALRPLPRVIFIFHSDAPAGNFPTPASSPAPIAAERGAASVPPEFRQQLENRFGGAITLQEFTDRALESSASILARAHAVQTLASKFPPGVAQQMPAHDRDLLRTLQQRHAMELRRLLVQVKTDLQPLLPSTAPAPQAPAGDWQSAAPMLVASAQTLDEMLNRLLAGSYTQASGQEMLRDLPSAIERLDAAVQAQQQGAR